MELNDLLVKEFKDTKKSRYVNVIGFFCNKDGCLTYMGDDIKTSITLWDSEHLTPSTAKYFVKNFLVRLIVDDN